VGLRRRDDRRPWPRFYRLAASDAKGIGMTRVTDVDPDEEIVIESAEVAPMLLMWLEQSGAILRLDAEQRLRVDLDQLPDMDQARAARLAQLILSVRDEIRALLIARNGTTVH
jgi:hypothetical protein